MPKKKRISLLLLLAVAVFGGVIILVRHGQGQTSPATGTQVKALRSKSQLHVKPTAAEIASQKNKFQVPPPSMPKEERELDDQIPKHLPIRIKIKKEKEDKFKDLKNDNWPRDLEIEVTNSGEKDIYFLGLNLILPEIKSENGNNVAFTLHYGRAELGNLPTKARSDDIPIRPRETHVFKIIENQVLGFQGFNRKLKRPQPRKVILHFSMLSFGDGTGFMGITGLFFPRPEKEISSRCLDSKSRDSPPTFEWERRREREIGRKKTLTTRLPASYLPVNYFSADISSSSINLNPQTCCNGAECLQSRPWTNEICYNCGLRNGLNLALCSDPLGHCWDAIEQSVECVIPETGEVYLCPQVEFAPCGGPTPTPTPTPAPSPTPTPSPTPCPLNCTDPTAILADPCNPNRVPSTGCPIGYTQNDNCCPLPANVSSSRMSVGLHSGLGRRNL